MEEDKIIQENTERRNRLYQTGGRLSKQDRDWLLSTTFYCPLHGYPNLIRDIIETEPKREYEFTVTMIEKRVNYYVSPIFMIGRLRGGYIQYAGETKSAHTGKIETNVKTKSLSTCNDEEHPECSFKFKSDFGKLIVDVESDFSKGAGGAYLSSIENYNFNMKVIENGENYRIYDCTTDSTHKYGDYIFKVTWRKLK